MLSEDEQCSVKVVARDAEGSEDKGRIGWRWRCPRQLPFEGKMRGDGRRVECGNGRTEENRLCDGTAPVTVPVRCGGVSAEIKGVCGTGRVRHEFEEPQAVCVRPADAHGRGKQKRFRLKPPRVEGKGTNGDAQPTGRVKKRRERHGIGTGWAGNVALR